MKIFFQNKCFELDNVEAIARNNPAYSSLVNFIVGWKNGKEIFEFQTSGSTGDPKKIPIQRKQILASVAMTKKALDLKSNDRVLLCLNPEYIASIMMIARCLVLDLDLFIIEPKANPFQLLDKEIVIDFVSLVPFQIEKILSDGNATKLEKVKNILIGGAPISIELIDKIKKIDTNIYQSYGMTETVSHVALMNLHNGDYFKALEGIEIRKDERDCLCIRGEVTNNIWIQTNDIIDLISDITFFWKGRYDNVINSGGIKISPEKFEISATEFFTEHKFQNSFFFFGTEDYNLGQKIGLIFEKNMPEREVINSFKNWIISSFSKYHIPKEIIVIDSFMRTNSGKIKRKETLKKYYKNTLL